MANVVTDEPEAPPVEMLTAPAIRDAILALVPDDANIQRDIRIHDNVADISIKWRTLRWATSMALHDQTPEDIAHQTMRGFCKWVVGSMKNRGNTPKYEHVLRDMNQWLLGKRGAEWAIGLKYDQPTKVWSFEDGAPSKTEYASEAV